jgi:predicted site-specific integrase-resolvase
MKELYDGKIAFSPAETCRALGISRTTLWRLGKAGLLSPFKLHGLTLYRRADLEAMVDKAYQETHRKGPP